MRVEPLELPTWETEAGAYSELPGTSWNVVRVPLGSARTRSEPERRSDHPLSSGGVA
jgi:hypothetical protein